MRSCRSAGRCAAAARCSPSATTGRASGRKPSTRCSILFFTTKPVGKGTGLGLSISYGIVERHRGQLKAANHPKGGAVLTLTLPLAVRPG
ncbi:MAG: ATP-binding protein [Rhodocyclaceae bacterium]|nr:ATP-binding protein [Rhodocyclaceae bacterium]